MKAPTEVSLAKAKKQECHTKSNTVFVKATLVVRKKCDETKLPKQLVQITPRRSGNVPAVIGFRKASSPFSPASEFGHIPESRQELAIGKCLILFAPSNNGEEYSAQIAERANAMDGRIVTCSDSSTHYKEEEVDVPESACLPTF